MIAARSPRLAVVGAGAWACRWHLPALHALGRVGAVEIAGVWNRTPASAVAAARRFGVARVYGSLDEIVEDPGVDGIVVLVASTAVVDVVTRLLPARRPIFAEKPPGASYRDAQLLAARVDVPNVVGFNRRYMPLSNRFRELVAGIDGAYHAECRLHRNDRDPRDFVAETGVHGINTLEYVCGPIGNLRVPGHAGDSGVPAWIATLRFECGMTGLVKLFPCSGASVERYEVHGRDRSIYYECPVGYCSDRPGRVVVHERGQVVAVITDDDPADELRTLGFIAEHQDFLRAIAAPGWVTASNFSNAANTMRVAEAIAAGDSPRREG